ncbi:MAG: carbohydrate ABC transporter permease [Christensenellales bacterium]
MTVKQTNKIRKNSTADMVYIVITEVILWFMLVIILIPLVYIVSSSFSSPEAVGNGWVYLWPVDFSLKGYAAVFTTEKVWIGFRNSIFYTVVGTFINIVVTMLAAYPLSRRDLKGRGVVTVIFTFTMLFSGGMIPTYLLVRDLRMINTVWAMLIPGAMSVYNVIIARTYIQSSIPFDLYESASLDGCTDDRYLISVVLPLAKPIIAVLVLWYAVGHWNQYFNAMIYLRDSNLLPLQIVLRNFLIVEDMNDSSLATMSMEEYMDKLYLKNLYQYSLIVIASAPVMMLYPFIQKHFVKGIMLGSLKG